ncbi:hypothetical protein G7046_g9595 [Stylonectria norvegica]|nr:hypothetical protein G7046_g9595 [Stylonectria norvegica]
MSDIVINIRPLVSSMLSIHRTTSAHTDSLTAQQGLMLLPLRCVAPGQVTSPMTTLQVSVAPNIARKWCSRTARRRGVDWHWILLYKESLPQTGTVTPTLDQIGARAGLPLVVFEKLTVAAVEPIEVGMKHVLQVLETLSIQSWRPSLPGPNLSQDDGALLGSTTVTVVQVQVVPE